MQLEERKYFITGYTSIRENQVLTGNKMLAFPDGEDHSKLFKLMYKHLYVDYPKFYKMDRLCKLAYLNAEYLFQNIDTLKNYMPEEVAMVFMNSTSSIFSDLEHNSTIFDRNSYYPKPAVFVYTLPNIMLGEISIRFLFRGENYFFISEQFNSAFITDYVTNLMDTTRHKACLIGWVDYSVDGYESVMFFLEKNNPKGQEELFSVLNLESKFRKFANLK